MRAKGFLVAALAGLTAIPALAQTDAKAHAPTATAPRTNAPAATASAEPFVLHELAPGVYAAIDGPAHQAGSNAGIIIGDDGVAVVDSLFTPKAAQALVAAVHRLTDKPIRYVINTHYHLDHTGGDGVLKAAGAVIIAQTNVRTWLHSENPHLLGDHMTPALKAEIDALPEPDITVDRRLTLWLGARRVELRYWPGHTGGDLVVSVPDAKVVFCGDLFWNHVSPNLIDGTVSQWIATDAGLAKAPDAEATTFVPGHGEVGRIDDLIAFKGYLSTLSADVVAARVQGLSGQTLSDNVAARMKTRYGDWSAFGYFIPKEIGFMAAELDGTKVVPQPAGPEAGK
jgi:glyoxylase-like metal-dependent hydrolase (beta-lactamase superfamily II)